LTQEQTTINSIALKINRLEIMQETNTKAIGEMASGITRLVDKMDESDDVAKEARDRSKSAHYRIDDLNKRVDDMKTSNRWAIGTSLTVLAVFLTAIGILIRLLGK
jgi:methyl-accepting chemotaxis protein